MRNISAKINLAHKKQLGHHEFIKNRNLCREEKNVKENIAIEVNFSCDYKLDINISNLYLKLREKVLVFIKIWRVQ